MKFFKKTILFLLVTAMMLSLAACGGSSSSSSGSPSGESAAQAVATSATPETVYKSTYSTLMEGTSNTLTAQYYTDNGVYVTGYETVGNTADPDVIPDYVGQYDITEQRIYFISYDGTVQTLSDYEPKVSTQVADETSAESEAAADQAASAESDNGSIYNFETYTYIVGMSLKDNGNLVVLESVYSYWDDIQINDWTSDDYNEHHFYQSLYYIRELDANGAEVSSTVLQPGENEYYDSTCILDDNGNILVNCSTYDGTYSILGISTTGEIVYTIPVDDYVSGFFRTDDGSVYVTVWANDMELHKLDTENQKLGPVEGTVPSDAYTILPGGGDYSLYYVSGTNFYGLDPATGESTKLFSWLDCDVNSDYLTTFNVDSEGVIRTVTYDYDSVDQDFTTYLVTVTEVPYDPSMQKQVITVGAQYASYELKEAIIDFNRSHDDLRVELVDYSEFNTEDDYSAGITKMNTEIMAGNGPDVFALDGLNTTQLAARGLLEDLYPYLDADSELNRDDYFENVLKAAEKNGALVQTVNSFSLYTVIGAQSIVGDGNSWTYQDLQNALSDMPDGCTAFDISTTRSEVLNNLLCLNMNEFVNWETGEVNFDNDEFISILEFANQFPDSYDYSEYNYETDTPEARIASGQQMLYSSTITGVDVLNYIEACFQGQPISFIGYPNDSGKTGTMISIDSGYGMSSSCSDKDAAWEFLRIFFTKEMYLSNYSYMLPAFKDEMSEQIEDATTPRYEVDSTGHFILDANGEKILKERVYGMDTSYYTYYALSEQIAEQFMDLLNSTTSVYNADQDMLDIVNEQTEAFFAGQKTSQEVAKLVQSKANIYVNEQR